MATTSTPLNDVQGPDLGDRRVVVLGGTGGVGEGIVRSWLEAGADVIVPSRTQARADEFRALLGDDADRETLHIVLGDSTSFEAADTLAAQITEQFGEVTDVVASIGGWWQRVPLWQVTDDEWNRWFVDLTTAHVAAVRAWIPRLGASGSYHLILGGSAVTPVPTASLMNMEQAALLMMHQVLSAEVGDQRRIFGQVLGPVDTRQRSWVDPTWVSSRLVGLFTTLAAASTEPSTLAHVRTREQMAVAVSNLLGREVVA